MQYSRSSSHLLVQAAESHPFGEWNSFRSEWNSFRSEWNSSEWNSFRSGHMGWDAGRGKCSYTGTQSCVFREKLIWSFFWVAENNLGVRTSKAGFSKIAYDQKHEMNNKTIKSRGGYINLVNTKDTSNLRKIEICYAEVNELLKDWDETIGTTKHKEKSSTFNKTFLSHCNQVFAQMTINPFTAGRFQMLNGILSFPPEVIRDCTRLFSVGKEQYQDFVLTSFILGSKEVI